MSLWKDKSRHGDDVHGIANCHQERGNHEICSSQMSSPEWASLFVTQSIQNRTGRILLVAVVAVVQLQKDDGTRYTSRGGIQVEQDDITFHSSENCTIQKSLQHKINALHVAHAKTPLGRVYARPGDSFLERSEPDHWERRTFSLHETD